MKAEKINVAIVDDHQIVIDGITSLLRWAMPYISSIAISPSTIWLPKCCINLANYQIWIFLLTDIMMPDNEWARIGQKSKTTISRK
jgi:DNA-binding NarL/FixJ family response regulator